MKIKPIIESAYIGSPFFVKFTSPIIGIKPNKIIREEIVMKTNKENKKLIELCELIVKEGLKELEKQEKERRLNDELWKLQNGEF